MMKCEVAVIGAGPAGSIAAEESAKDYDTVIFEEHKKQPVHCAGLISKTGFGRLGIPERDFILNKIRGAKIFSPKGTCIEISPKETKAFVVDRSAFDDYLLSKAVSSGAEYVNSRVDTVGGEFFHKKNKKINAEKIILATGTDYKLQRAAGINTPKEFLFGAQYDMMVECETDMVELHFILPEFFAWIIPAGDFARVGLCAKKNAVQSLDAFVAKLNSSGRLKNQKISKKVFGTIPVYDPKLKTSGLGANTDINLVGDAAGHVKATTGGGIILGGLAARHAASEDYESEWKSEIGRELRLHLAMHRFLASLPDKKKDKLFSAVAKNHKTLEDSGDMDAASATLGAILKNPRFAFDLLPFAPNLIKHMIL
ncbi:MAG: hypothetical protein MSIBF_05545 [Candidatus Altiarchaeales archaeon IMC4]|nr:MAG: hypothetical protein MSIBF_05545 [Candidatus Altiarchaeales archaeon IMC4]